MALVDPYSTCPCGSGKKYKWCCQKAEAYADRGQRLEENGQHEAALAVYNEGLAKIPGNAWLLLRKAILLVEMSELEEARRCVMAVAAAQPGNGNAAILLIQLAIQIDGPVHAAAELQRALLNAAPEARRSFSRLMGMVASELAGHHEMTAGLKHLELAVQLDDAEHPVSRQALASLRRNAAIVPWLKQPYDLEETPAGLPPAAQQQFGQALGWAREGLWDSAAAAFDLMSSDRQAGQAATYNLGLCRLWLGESDAAVSALRRWIAREGRTTKAVDMETLCQLIDSSPDPDPIERVQLSWPLRNRAGLQATLTSEPTMVQSGERHLDPEDENSPEVTAYSWLDRSPVRARADLTPREVPVVLADVLLAADTVVLEAFDDGRLNSLIDRFAALAGRSVPPAQPRTKVIGTLDRLSHAMSWHWYLPPELPDPEKERITRERRASLISTVWPETPQLVLRGRTPAQAARAADSEVPLRAALMLLEYNDEPHAGDVDWNALRERLGVPPEPAIDPQTADVASVPLARLAFLPVPQLSDDRLVQLYLRAREWGITSAVRRAAHELVGRPVLDTLGDGDRRSVYLCLCFESVDQHDRAQALRWLHDGQAKLGTASEEDKVFWESLEIQAKAHLDHPESWVPELAALLQRLRGQAALFFGAHDPDDRDGAGATGRITGAARRDRPRHPDATAGPGALRAQDHDLVRRDGRCRAPERDLDAPVHGAARGDLDPGISSESRRDERQADHRDRLSHGPDAAGSSIQGDPSRMTAATSRDATLSLVHEGWNHLMSQRPLAAWGTWQRALRLDRSTAAARMAIETLEGAADLPMAARKVYRFRKPATDARKRAGTARWAASRPPS